MLLYVCVYDWSRKDENGARASFHQVYAKFVFKKHWSMIPDSCSVEPGQVGRIWLHCRDAQLLEAIGVETVHEERTLETDSRRTGTSWSWRRY